jgi:hypothetical protein
MAKTAQRLLDHMKAIENIESITGFDRKKSLIQAAVFGLGRWGQNLVNSVQGKSKHVQFKRAVVQKIPARKCTEFAEQKNLLVTY